MPSVRSLARRIAATPCKTRWSCPKRESSSVQPPTYKKHATIKGNLPLSSYKPKQLTKSEQQEKAASLVEQLFPVETKRYQAQEDKRAGLWDVSRKRPNSQTEPSERDVPLIVRWKPGAEGSKGPRELVKTAFGIQGVEDVKEDSAETEHKMALKRRIVHVQNASLNLTEDDFRRLVPRGEHIEGWRSDRDDIIRALPIRDPSTLLHKGEYYLLFPEMRAAEVYIEHVWRIQDVAAKNVPKSEFSAIAPPPGYEEDGVDIDGIVRAYTIALPTRPIALTIRAPPYEGLAKMLVTHKGVPPYQTRHGRTPFEVRFAMEGPQLSVGALRHIIMEDGVERGQSWSGTESKELTIWEWDPEGATPLTKSREIELAQLHARRAEMAAAKNSSNPALPRRKANPIFLISFPTQNAALSFVCYWHRRTIEKKLTSEYEIPFATDAPVADVQYLS